VTGGVVISVIALKVIAVRSGGVKDKLCCKSSLLVREIYGVA
jgi:hypothetical protein